LKIQKGSSATALWSITCGATANSRLRGFSGAEMRFVFGGQQTCSFRKEIVRVRKDTNEGNE